MKPMEDAADFCALSCFIKTGHVLCFFQAATDIAIGKSANAVGAIHHGRKQLGIITR
jgi:hypothetical protein